MDAIELACPSCARVLKVPAKYLGASGQCNHCGGQIVISSRRHAHAREGGHSDAPKAISMTLPSFKKLIDAVYDILARHSKCNFEGKAVLFLMDEEAGGLRLAETSGQFSREFLEEEAFVPLGKCLCGRAAQSGRVLVCRNCFDDPQHENCWIGMQTHGHCVIPLTHAGRVLGVLTLYTRVGVQADERQMALLEKLGDYSGNELQRMLRSA
jgi:GAF domain-containing protein